MIRILLVAALLLPAPLLGQRLAPLPSYALSAAAGFDRDFAAREIPRTYWVEGGLAVGIPMAVLGALFAGGLCEQDCTSSMVLGVAVGGVVGFTIGALIGGQFRKAP